MRAALGDHAAARLLLGVVAQLSPWKGQDTAIEALARVTREGLDAHLLLIGSAKFVARSTRFDNTRYVARLKQSIVAGGLERRVSWLGEREDVPELMRALDIVLLPSWEEPFGRALIEAMAMGVPIISTDVGGPGEVLTDGVEGRLLSPRDAAAWAPRSQSSPPTMGAGLRWAPRGARASSRRSRPRTTRTRCSPSTNARSRAAEARTRVAQAVARRFRRADELLQ